MTVRAVVRCIADADKEGCYFKAVQHVLSHSVGGAASALAAKEIGGIVACLMGPAIESILAGVVIVSAVLKI